VSVNVQSLAGASLAGQELLLAALLLAAALGGFGIGISIRGERLRRAEWRIRRAEAMSASLRKVSDEYRRRLRVRSPQQAEKKLEDQERKLSLLRFQVANLSSELKSLNAPPSGRAECPVIDLTGTRRNTVVPAKRTG
jgi:uncharacterized protein HemX